MKDDPATLRKEHGIRFHHFYLKNGRLLATLCTKPSGDETVHVGFALVASADAPSKIRGRQIALARCLLGGDSAGISSLKERIKDRRIFHWFVTDHTAARIGFGGDFHPKTGRREETGSVSRMIAAVRPRKPFSEE